MPYKNAPYNIERINLVYKGEIINSANITHIRDIREAIEKWLINAKPALKRGEKVIIELEPVSSWEHIFFAHNVKEKLGKI